jgi:transcriptional regulator with XRE-family HTH domain
MLKLGVDKLNESFKIGANTMKNLNDFFKQEDTPSEKELAEQLDVSVQYIYMLKKFERTPSPKFALRLSEATGIPVDALLFPDNEPTAA